jgi:hypothetical protein
MLNLTEFGTRDSFQCGCSTGKNHLDLNSKILSLIFLFLVLITGITFGQIETRITPDDGAEKDNFGHDVAICGDYLVAGAPYDDNELGTDAGAAYVFHREGSQWIQQAKLMASDATSDDLFGYPVDMDGEYIVVGAPWDDDAGEKSGAAYVYKLEDGTWTEQAKLTADDASEDDRFGIDVEISGETIAVGAFFDDVVGNRSGSAYVFKRDGSSWTQQAKLLPGDGGADDWFGVVLAMHGDDVAVASRRNDEMGSNAGAVYVYHREDDEWTEQVKLTAFDAEPGDEYGSPCIYGNTLVVSAHLDDDKGQNSGSIYYYQRQSGEWNLQAKYTASDGRGGEYFGGVALTPTHMVVSAYRDNDMGSNSGSFYVYKRQALGYFQIAKITTATGAAGDYFGLKNSMSGNYIVVGARNHDLNGDNAGAAFVYNLIEYPQIVSVKDIPNDQGGKVEIKWTASFYDLGRNLSHYSIWQALAEVPAATQSSPNNHENRNDAITPIYRTTTLNGTTQTWGWVANVPGHRLEEYVYSAPTLCDSMAATDGKHYFMVSAHLDDEDVFFDSNVDSGCSVDNLAPPPPTGLTASLAGNSVELAWQASPVPDFAYYVIYRDGEILDNTPKNYFVDSVPEQNRTYRYRLQAVDVHGNASELSPEVTVTTTSVSNVSTEKPDSYRLFNNHPNPFNPETEIRFALPKTSQVALKIYNPLGREIVTLVNAKYAAGTYQVRWTGCDRSGNSVASGIYLFVLQAGEFRAQKKMSLVR